MYQSNYDSQEQQGHIVTLLLANRERGTDWGEFDRLDGKPWSQKTANKFLLCCLLDYQIDTDLAWRNGHRLAEDILGDPDDIWQAITACSESEWNSKREAYRLPRFPAAHSRLWRIGRRLCEEYAGDARRIWEGKNAPEVLGTLWNLGAGEQISRMVVGALRECGQIEGATSDVKGDRYVGRVLGRALLGKTMDPEKAVDLARRLHPADPWQLDSPLFHIGRNYCKKAPACLPCYLAPHCAYALADEGREDHRNQLYLSPLRTEDSRPEIILQVGAEGGSITLLRARNPDGDWHFQMKVSEAALYDLLSEEDRGHIGEYFSRTGYVQSFQEGLRLLDRYPWFRLSPLEVHREFLGPVLREVHQRGGPIEKARWREELMRQSPR